MTSDRSATPLSVLGFLTVAEHEPHGLFGGYLLLNGRGRPLEFHCTAPVKPSRAQQILFGPTLDAYTHGEQIGRTLAAKASARPVVLLTDVPAMLSLRPFVEQPVVLVLPEGLAVEEADTSVEGRRYRVDGPHVGPTLVSFRAGAHRLAVDACTTDDRAIAVRELEIHAPTLDLIEPFGRIRAAIDEAQRGAK